MNNPLYIYAGPSWAVSSYPVSSDATNLADEWKIEKITVADNATGVAEQLRRVKRALKENVLPVVWIYNEPIGDLELITGLSTRDFVQRKDWKAIVEECNKFSLESINSVGVPVFVIGGHRDIVDCDYQNITVGHHSWQKWLAEQAGMRITDDIIEVTPADGGNYNLSHCWGAEIIHRFLHSNTDISPDKKLLDSVWDMYFFWDELQKRNWFFEVHPNKRGNVEFAKFLKPSIDKFLKDNSNG